MNFIKSKKYLINFFLLALIFPQATHAYAGPGAAIGAIVVFLTVIFAFSASIFISIFNFVKKLINRKNKSKDKKESDSKNKS